MGFFPPKKTRNFSTNIIKMLEDKTTKFIHFKDFWKKFWTKPKLDFEQEKKIIR